jgi:hypothetical protein
VVTSLDAAHKEAIARRRVERAVAQGQDGWWWEDRDGFLFGPSDTCEQAEAAALAHLDQLAPLPLDELVNIELEVFA